jgi:hypothetical protein
MRNGLLTTTPPISKRIAFGGLVEIDMLMERPDMSSFAIELSWRFVGRHDRCLRGVKVDGPRQIDKLSR